MDRNHPDPINELGRKFSDATILMHQQIAAKAGLSGADHKYLSILMDHEPMTAGQLAKLTGLSTGAVTGVIDRLEKKKLVKRTFSKADRRKILIVLNYENTMKLLGNTFAMLQNRMETLMKEFTPAETKIIEKYLRKTITALEDVTDALKKE